MAGPKDTPRGVVEYFDDFMGDLLRDEWNITADSGGAVTVVEAVDGELKLLNDTTDDDVSMIALGLNWRAQDGGMGLEIRLRSVNAINVSAIGLGWTDATTESSLAPSELTCGGITTTQSSGMGFLQDLDAATCNWFVYGVDDDNDNACGNFDTGVGPTISEFQTLRIEVQDMGSGNMAKANFFVDGNLEKTLLNVVDRDVILTPYVALTNRTAAATDLRVDYVHAWKTRRPHDG